MEIMTIRETLSGKDKETLHLQQDLFTYIVHCQNVI